MTGYHIFVYGPFIRCIHNATLGLFVLKRIRSKEPKNPVAVMNNINAEINAECRETGFSNNQMQVKNTQKRMRLANGLGPDSLYNLHKVGRQIPPQYLPVAFTVFTDLENTPQVANTSKYWQIGLICKNLKKFT